MSLIAFFGALEIGFLYGLVGLGVYLSFRILDFPDLTVDGSFPLGGAIAATLIVSGVNPFIATFVAFLGGGVAGLVTAWLNVQFQILHLLASILTAIALYSINLRIMGRPNIPLLGEDTIFTPLEKGIIAPLPEAWMGGAVLALSVGAIVFAAKIALDGFLNSQLGLGMRATGVNPVMASAQGISTVSTILWGIALSNALVAVAGAMFAQLNGSADVTMGVGTIIFGLAATIVGETVLSPITIRRATLGVLIGSILYRLAVGLALNADFIGLQAQDLNLVTAVLVALALVLPRYRDRLKSMWRDRAQNG
ncbi:ABC transporter permease [Lusitaniella coriacea LEGE 07157]|uniref:ABC transporter permease n=1 Tax=Lusitaniella coriacea LEGE 07157 TaxID=945747 RepID=A0A8J7DND8_9CYAN|nr:ABC transporter permease [Lusitaniella coriacea]MBE9114429.1 ABC transporter permease [Lusitaniella coriacea LEGE 07157]